MDLTEFIQPGMVSEESFQVQEQNLAQHLGSGSLRVLATPAMIAFMEGASHRLLARHIPEGSSSVGVLVNVRHLAPTPFGSTVRVRTEVTGIDGLQVSFKVQAWDEREQIGEGEHLRVVVDHARFLKRVAAKTAALGAAEDHKS